MTRGVRTGWSALALIGVGVVVLGACSSGGEDVATPGVASTNRRATRPTSAGPTIPTGSTRAPSPAAPQREEPGLPRAIQEAAATAVADRLYVLGGYDTMRNSSAATFVFDGSAWASGPTLPIRVNHPGAATINSDVYVAGGFTASGATNRVFVLASGAAAWREVAPMQRARGALSLVAVGQRLYAIGGRDASVEIAVPEVYEPRSNTWTDAATMPHPRNHLAAFVDGVLVCVAGGRTPATSGAIDCLDTGSGTWQSSGVLPVPTSGAAATFTRGVTIVAGGEPSGETSITGVVQRLAANRWTTEPMLVPRHGTAFAVYHGRLWMCGGATAAGFHAVSSCTSLTP